MNSIVTEQVLELKFHWPFRINQESKHIVCHPLGGSMDNCKRFLCRLAH